MILPAPSMDATPLPIGTCDWACIGMTPDDVQDVETSTGVLFATAVARISTGDSTNDFSTPITSTSPPVARNDAGGVTSISLEELYSKFKENGTACRERNF
eukprot:CAMPEP_0184684912 /NCGR_PEP_ID=MMETSP0312-20130426/17099_1 /TAXON_ID=31354 /ORGANISM="Compsopogon coeruleus, Strain SAG 36.94" /LENGTH=100 /DNA_ID=CAMNT_0027138551 /DNA_START=822 /DNA_END=1124 /DNA_ORIENTATION=-